MGMPARQVRLAGESGFTLMEVLIAVTITAVIGLGVWQVVSSVMNSRDRVDEVAQALGGVPPVGAGPAVSADVVGRGRDGVESV